VSTPGRAGLIGESPRRQDGDELLTGRARFTADLDLPGTVHMAVVRSPYAHADLRSVEMGRARRHPRVLAVIDGAEAAEYCDPIAHNLDPAGLGGRHADVRCLAVEKVRYVGEPIAAVVAETEADAKAAAALVVGDYGPLPVVLDAGEALAPSAPRLYEEWDSNEMITLELGSGSIDSPPDGARRLRGRFSVQRSTAAPIEPRAYVAEWDRIAQRLTWYGTTQNPHPLRSVLAKALRLSESQVRVVMPRIGGSFGLKMHGHPEEVLVGLLARATTTDAT
jgi:aerobic carbon-monoxide dehydrogenase large subunit